MLLGETRRLNTSHFASFCTLCAVQKNVESSCNLLQPSADKDSLDSEMLVPYQCVLKREDLIAIWRFVCLPILTPL